MVRTRVRILIVLLTIPFLVVVGRLAALQLWQDSQSALQLVRAEDRQRRVNFIPYTRGSILDRNGKVLAQDIVTFDLEFTLHGLHPRERYLPVLEKIFQLCDERCWTVKDGARDAKEVLDCRGCVLEEHLQALTAERDLRSLAREEADPAGMDPILVNHIPPSIRAKVDRELRGGLRALDRKVGLYFMPASDGTCELRVRPRKTLGMEITLERISLLTGEMYQVLRKRVAEAEEEVAEAGNAWEKNFGRNGRQRSRLLARDIKKSSLTRILYRPDLFPGIRIVNGKRRTYPQGECAAAITGYLRLPGEEERDLILDYYLPDMDFLFSEKFQKHLRWVGCRKDDREVGLRGLERYYNNKLRGAYGVRVEEIDARHVPRRELYYLAPERGEDLHTTLDVELQNLIYERIGDLCIPRGEARAGSVVVMDLTGRMGPGGAGPPGAILAAVGFPGFRPDLFQDPEYRKRLDRLEKEHHQGIYLNRPLWVHHPPGSVFKLVVAAAALEGGVKWPDPGHLAPPVISPLDPSTRYLCKHWLYPEKELGPTCLSRLGHGELDLYQAIQHSCNIYFYRLGRDRLQPRMLWAWARELGFGRSPGIDLEDPGADLERPSGLLVADTINGRPIRSRDMCQYAIGGPSCVSASVLQVVRAISAIALGGDRVPWPFLATSRPPERLEMKSETARVIREGMRRVVHEPGGTASANELGMNRYRVAVKTGTAEIRPNPPANYAWMAGFAPLERPEIAFAVCIERTPHHGSECARVVEPILDFFARKEPEKYYVKVPGDRAQLSREDP